MTTSYQEDQRARDEAVTTRLRELQDMGFFQGFALDIRVGDIVTKTPGSFEFNWPQGRIVAVTRVLPVDASYFEPEEDRVLANTVVHFVGYDENDIQREFAYGHTHAFHIYRPS